MNAANQPPMRFPWPVTILIVCAALAILANAFFMLPWFRGPFGEFLAGMGVLLALGGSTLIVLVFLKFRKKRTPVAPYSAAAYLVTDGPFAISRNPIYLGAVTILMALAPITGNPWFAIFGILAALAIGRLAIRPEERHLEMRFGKAYRDYAKRVRRWF